ncbi:hypothetical protein [Streptomyces sp. NPDC053367]
MFKVITTAAEVNDVMHDLPLCGAHGLLEFDAGVLHVSWSA